MAIWHTSKEKTTTQLATLLNNRFVSCFRKLGSQKAILPFEKNYGCQIDLFDDIV